MRTYIGVDYHRGLSYMTAMDERGKVCARGRVANDREAMTRFLKRADQGGCGAAVLEATRNWTVMYDLLEELVGEVHLAHPLKVKAIAEARIKTDKIDSEVLAHLLRCDLLPEAHVPGPAARMVRNVLRQRMFFVRVRGMIKSRVRGLPGYHHSRLSLGFAIRTFVGQPKRKKPNSPLIAESTSEVRVTNHE
jgi:transposase